MGGRAPKRLSEIIAIAEANGCTVEQPKGTSHWKFKRDGYRTYPVPAHNGMRSEVSWKYIQGLCRCLGLSIDLFDK